MSEGLILFFLIENNTSKLGDERPVLTSLIKKVSQLKSTSAQIKLLMKCLLKGIK